MSEKKQTGAPGEPPTQPGATDAPSVGAQDGGTGRPSPGPAGNGGAASPGAVVTSLGAASPRDLPPGALVTLARTLASPLSSRYEYARRIGKIYGNKRDVWEALGYPRNLTAEDYREEYERGGIAERIVESYPMATWSAGAIIYEDPDPEKVTEFEVQTEDLFRRYDIWNRLYRTDVLSRTGRFAIMLIGAPGDPSTPLPSNLGPDDLFWLASVGEDRVRNIEIVKDLRDERFGLPEFYRVVFDGTAPEQTIHWSRVLHMAEGTLDDEIFGKPPLRAVWNYLINLEKVIGGGSEAAWKRMDPGMQLDLDPEVELGTEEEQALSDEVTEYIHGARRFIRTRGVDLKQLAANVAGFDRNADIILKLISGTTGIPFRILTGSERGELASSQDRNNWNDRIRERRTSYAAPVVIDLVNRFAEHGILPTPQDIIVDWPDIDDLNEIEKADTIGKIARANSSQVRADGTIIMTPAEARQRLYGLDPLDEDDAAGLIEHDRSFANEIPPASSEDDDEEPPESTPDSDSDGAAQ